MSKELDSDLFEEFEILDEEQMEKNEGRTQHELHSPIRRAADAVASMANNVVEDQLEKLVSKITGEAGRIAQDMLYDVIYQNKDLYGKTADGKSVKIYHNRSQLLDNLARKATGQGVDDLLRGFFPGMGGLLVMVRPKLERMLLDALMKQLAEMWRTQEFEKRVTRQLLEGTKRFTKTQIQEILNQKYPPRDNKDNPYVQEVEAVVVGEDKPLDEYNQSLLDSLAKQLREKIMLSLNDEAHKLLQFTLPEVSSGLAEAAVERGSEQVKSGLGFLGSLGSAAMGSFLPGIAGFLGQQAVDKIKPRIKAEASRQANELANKATNSLNQTPFFTISYNDNLVSKTLEDSEIGDVEHLTLVTPSRQLVEKAKGVAEQASKGLERVGKALDALHGFDEDEDVTPPVSPQADRKQPGLLAWVFGKDSAPKDIEANVPAVEAPKKKGWFSW